MSLTLAASRSTTRVWPDDEVMAFGSRRTNAQLMVDCATLGYLPEPILDPTYNRGRFWRLHRPEHLVASDLNPTHGVLVADFTRLPFADRSFATVVFDPPYKLNGKPSAGGPASSDDSYGVGERASVAERHQLIVAGIADCARVSDQYLHIKCQDQVCCGRKWWQTRIFAEAAEAAGFRIKDALHVQGWRKQPEGRGQFHARGDYSTLLVCVREGEPS